MGSGDRHSRLKPVAFYQNNILLDALFLHWDLEPLCIQSRWTQEIEVSESHRPSPTTTLLPCVFLLLFAGTAGLEFKDIQRGKRIRCSFQANPSKRKEITLSNTASWSQLLFDTGRFPPHSPVFSFPWVTSTQGIPGQPPQTVWCLTRCFSNEAWLVSWSQREK